MMCSVLAGRFPPEGPGTSCSQGNPMAIPQICFDLAEAISRAFARLHSEEKDRALGPDHITMQVLTCLSSYQSNEFGPGLHSRQLSYNSHSIDFWRLAHFISSQSSSLLSHSPPSHSNRTTSLYCSQTHSSPPQASHLLFLSSNIISSSVRSLHLHHSL